MELIIGGSHQGKLEYALEQNLLRMKRINSEQIVDMADWKNLHSILMQIEWKNIAILNHLHLFVRFCMEEGKSAQKEIEDILQQNPQLILICDEVGGGIVPMEASEREYREQIGRLCCMLAKEAQKVTRVYCSIGMVIKGAEQY